MTKIQTKPSSKEYRNGYDAIDWGHMAKSRWLQLMKDAAALLTAKEINQGWHFCCEWDGLLVGPGMKEQEACMCFK